MGILSPSLDTKSKTPLYEQLYTYIKAEIQSGKIPYASKLPSKRKLSSYMGISLNTIQAAYDQLIEEGYVISLERKGFYVCKLDNIKKIKIPTKTNALNNTKVKQDVKYDFSYSGVDTPSFPFTIWRRITKDVINEYDDELLGQGDSLGLKALRIAITEYIHQSRGVNCIENQIIISSGTEILFQTLISLMDSNCIYGIENPGYERLNQIFIANRANYKAVNIDSHGIIPCEVKKSGANILCVTPAHQFPSGEIMPINRRIQLLNWANETNGRYLVEDDYDSEFKYSGRPIPALQGLDMHEKVIYMGSLSKSLAPTIRVSYMVLPPHLMKLYNEKLSYILCPVPIINQKTLYRFIKDGYLERHLNKMRNIYKKKREILIKAIDKSNNNIKAIGADAGLHLLLKVSNGMSEDELISSAINKGVRVYGISKYYVDKSYIDNDEPKVLIGFASLSEDSIIEAVNLLSEAWFI